MNGYTEGNVIRTGTVSNETVASPAAESLNRASEVADEIEKLTVLLVEQIRGPRPEQAAQTQPAKLPAGLAGHAAGLCEKLNRVHDRLCRIREGLFG